MVTYLLSVPPPDVLSRNSTYTVVSVVNVYGDVIAVDIAVPFITHVSNAEGDVPVAVNIIDAAFDILNGAEYVSGALPSIVYETEPDPVWSTVISTMSAVAAKFAFAVMFVVNEDDADVDVPATLPVQCENSLPGSGNAVNDIAALSGAKPDAVFVTVAPWYWYDHDTVPNAVEGIEFIVTYLLSVPPPGVLSKNSTYTVVFDANVYADVVADCTATLFITHVSNAYGDVPEAMNTTGAVFTMVNGPVYVIGELPPIVNDTSPEPYWSMVIVTMLPDDPKFAVAVMSDVDVDVTDDDVPDTSPRPS